MASRTAVLATTALLLLGSGAIAAQQGDAGAPAHPQSVAPRASAPAVARQPDLFVVSIDFTHYQLHTKPDGTKQGSAYVGFTFKNGGKAKAASFSVTWEYWDHAAQAWLPFLGQFFTDQALEAGQSRSIGGQPVDAVIWTIGVDPPRFRARLDTTGVVAESNETNNEMIKEFKPLVAAPKAVRKLK
jgi:hypothetical protein